MTTLGGILFGVTSLAALIVGWWAGSGVPYIDQVQLLRELREVSTIIFGIMGAWSAIVYPEELKRSLRPTEANAVDSATLSRFRVLMRCIVLSAAIVCIILVMQFTAPILQQMGWTRNHAIELRAASFATGCVLAVAQIWVVWLMLVPVNAADADVRVVQQTQSGFAGGLQGKKGTRKKS